MIIFEKCHGTFFQKSAEIFYVLLAIVLSYYINNL